ncbi:MAG: CinA family protein [Endozoicomonadaceae bacterium]|nr:CinA family protein [Endozoicomonadaceae bacterium]MBE8233586.1 CinA family protein [Endozoicomonadaceae bacterium]
MKNDNQSFLKTIATICIKKKWKLVTVESCTGGGIGQTITQCPGSSQWYEGGWIAYANQFKIKQLHLNASLLKKYGAVSQPVVEQLARSALQLNQAQIALSITGVAGPGHGNLNHPIGTIWMAWMIHHKIWSSQFDFLGDRETIRNTSIKTALQYLALYIQRIDSNFIS